MTVEELYDKCLNFYSHEGEINFGDDTLTFFRRCSYEDFDNLDEDGNPKWVEGDEAVGVFINKEKFLGWYTGDCIENMKEAAEDALAELIKMKNITMTINVKYTYNESDLNASTRKEMREAIYKKLMENFNVEKKNISDLKIKFEEYGNDLYANTTCTIKLTNVWTIICIAKNKEPEYSCEEVTISDSDPNKDTFENYFDFRVDIL